MARAALITGGSRGIGLSFARALLEAGHDVAITAARDSAALEAARAGLAAAFGDRRVLAIQADAANAADADRAVADVLERFGRIDILVNNAGRGPREASQVFHHTPHPFWETDPEAWAEIIRSNVNGPFLMARAAAPYMVRAGWGRIVNVSTSRATMIKRGNAPYGPSKAALDAMTRQFADDLEGTGVTVNALAPGGPTDTAFFPAEGRSGVYLEMLPVEVMNEALVWICSEAADQVSAGKFIGKLWNAVDPMMARDDTGRPPRIL